MKDRAEFQTLMKLCCHRKVDLILVKSFSRLGRNMLDILRALRELRDLAWMSTSGKKPVAPRWENGDIDYCILHPCSKQEWTHRPEYPIGCETRIPNGDFRLCRLCVLWIQTGNDGRLTIDKLDAEIVCRIFQMRVEGKSLGAISDWLYDRKVSSPTGKERWSQETISKLLRNEEYAEMCCSRRYFWKMCRWASSSKTAESWSGISYNSITRRLWVENCLCR